MLAALCRAHGSLDNVALVDVPAPALGDGQVRVQVQAAAVNYPDVLLVADQYQFSVPPPFVVGSEFAGEVVEVAADVATPVVGERVFGATMVGAFAEQVVVPATSLTAVPADVDIEVAAAFGVAHRTAYHVLRSVARLSPGERLVVLGAGGGVGLAAVQLGAALGAEVTAVASSAAKLDAAQAAGAHHLVNHTYGDLRRVLATDRDRRVDVVVDPVGGELSEPALRAMSWGGRFVTVGYASGAIPKIPLNLVMLKGVHVLGFQFADFARHCPDELARNENELLGMLADGRARPHVGARFPLYQAVQSLRYVADRHAIGKVVLAVGDATGSTLSGMEGPQ